MNMAIKPTYRELEKRVEEREQNERHSKRIENALSSSEKHYETLVYNIQAAVVVHSPDTKIIASNPKAHELLGLTEDQMLGRDSIDPSWHFLNADGEVLLPDQYPAVQVLSNRKELRDFTAGIRRPDKQDLVWVSVSADPVFDDNQEIKQVVVTFMDITERKRIAEELQKSYDNLEERVEARTAELREALADVRTLSGLLLICAECKNIRDDKGYWSQIESYISKHSNAEFSHSICPACVKKLYPNLDGK